MKKLFIYFFFIVSSTYSQTSDALKLCVAIQNNFTSNYEANNAVDKILSVIGTSQKPILQSCSNINNAVAASYKGQRYILYDKVFMESLTVGRNKYWSNMFILAHEVGHHINGHSLDIILYQNDVINPKSLSTRRSQELEADEFAGFVLAKLGATFNQTSKVLLNIPKISNDYDSTHPSTDKRIRAVKNGWERGYVKKETKTVYVSDAIGEYERSDSYVRHGKWYREQNDDVFEGRTFNTVTSGILKGVNEYFNKAPIIKIEYDSKKSTYKRYELFIEKEPLNSLPASKDSKKGDLIVLDSNGKIISKTKIQVYSSKDSGFLSVEFGYKVYDELFRLHSDELFKDFKNGSKLLIRFDDYTKAYHNDIKEYVKSNSLYKINNYGIGGGYDKLYNKTFYKGVYISSQYWKKRGLETVAETNYENRLFTSYELLSEIKKLKNIASICKYSKRGGVGNISYTTPSNLKVSVNDYENPLPRTGNCNMSRFEYDLKIDNLIQKLLDLNSEIFAMKKQVIEVKGAYFEYSLSGSSKALAE